MSAAGKNLSKDFHSDCSVCRFWKRIDDVIGECYRNAPSPVVDTSSSVAQRATQKPLARWPITNAVDVCGDFALETDK